MRFHDYGIPLLIASLAHAQWDPSRYLYFDTPGSSLSSSLPIGNGRVAAAVYGTATEKITLNENSVWNGQWQDRGNAASLGNLSSIRQKLIDGNLTGAGQQTLDAMTGNPQSPRQYHPTVDMNINFGHNATLENYTRVLDTLQGTAGTTYKVGSVTYR
jgi:hypothetical protein